MNRTTTNGLALNPKTILGLGSFNSLAKAILDRDLSVNIP